MEYNRRHGASGTLVAPTRLPFKLFEEAGRR
jgi:hypothetical protein